MQVEVAEIIDGSVSPEFLVPYDLRSVASWGSTPDDHADGLLYILLARDIGYAPGWDWRCH